MCGIKGIVIDQPDHWGKTPLHYASQRGASICAMYLERRGANLESIDTYGNTPLGIGLLNDHHNFGIIMIQKNANVNAMVYKVEEKKQEEPNKAKK
jgi:ankyrin repeat protein